ncbi:hypothetical protein B0J11DRAFT_436764 [Dendryphion nanum]|uniref:Myb-like domain-containing protein n=1 Tax=Dendryphion nanum TaxID=256645 RepID=A0A9P9DNN4_9PLEO|nr:hypothetical protein B0J11DRAFT_436764 [Dendryphion nanum]
MPGQGARWTPEGTEQFYDALATFGTDFAMVATMFPGLTRRSIKMKFNREERDDPARIRRVLNGPRKNADWADYLTQSGRTDDSYVDADEIMRQLAAEREEMELQIQAALEAKEEQRRQRVAAGLPVTDDEGAGEKDGGGKKKKRGKNREKQAKGFAVEAGVEIVDDVAGFSD